MGAPYRPGPEDMQFVDQSTPVGTTVDESTLNATPAVSAAMSDTKYPPAIIDISEERRKNCVLWLDQWITDLESMQQVNQDAWARQEEAYRAKPDGPKSMPFEGAATHVVPAIAMAVDPIHARLDTGIFKQDPVIQLKALKKSMVKYIPALNTYINFYIKNKLRLRAVASPRLLEMTKLGTCVFKTVYDQQKAKIKTYDTSKDTWEVITKEEIRFQGPRVFGIGLGDFLFPPLFQHAQDCPILVERQRTTIDRLRVAEASKKIQDVDKVQSYGTINPRTRVEEARETASGHQAVTLYHDEIIVYECWFDYDVNGDGLPEHMVATYHRDSQTLLQLRYNWYFHQRKPYTVIPYQLTNDSLLGIGICEMVQPFQEMLTKWDQMASDNAYLANIRMFIVKKESGIEAVPRLYAGRCFFVDDPKSDFIPFAVSDIYPSTLSERQNLFGLVEKRTGVSDYLTGRESPIIGSRATATSTLALIQEGTKRVEEVLENIRNGFAEIIENCFYIWIQYGLEELDDIVFGDDETGQLVKEFFSKMSAENVNGAIAIDLTATDAAGNKQAMQQMQLQIIQIMMGYLEKTLQAGAQALQALQTMPELSLMIGDVMTAARKMFIDLLQKYDIRNPDDYLPDLEKYINAGLKQIAAGSNGAGQTPTGPGGAGGQLSLPSAPGARPGPPVPQPAIPGSGTPAAPTLPASRLAEVSQTS